LRNLKLYLAEFDPYEGMIAYSIEDENNDRVDKVVYNSESLKTYSPKNMDFFVLSYLPKLMSMGDNLKILGPVSKGLISELNSLQYTLIRSGIHPFGSTTLLITSIENQGSIDYISEDILKIAKIYLENNDLNSTLKFVFEYYLKEIKKNG
jgi:hypothetical protein